jgi:hypothetical protein
MPEIRRWLKFYSQTLDQCGIKGLEQRGQIRSWSHNTVATHPDTGEFEWWVTNPHGLERSPRAEVLAPES